jgi:hypothetical protein
MFLSALAQPHGLHIARKTANLVRLVHVSDVPAAMLFAEPGALEGKSPWVGVACNGAQNSTRGMLPILAFPSGRGGEIGRRTGLKIPGPQGRVGSIPTPGTIYCQHFWPLGVMGNRAVS